MHEPSHPSLSASSELLTTSDVSNLPPMGDGRFLLHEFLHDFGIKIPVVRSLPHMPQRSCCLNNTPAKLVRGDYVAVCT